MRTSSMMTTNPTPGTHEIPFTEFFNPSEPEDMCNAIESVVYSESRIADLTIRGLERLHRFSWTKCTQETLNIYRSLI